MSLSPSRPLSKTPFILSGSARVQGNTSLAIQALFPQAGPITDLCTLNMSAFDYQYGNRGDDFLPLITKMVDHDVWILASPVYWYTLSSHLKIFFDRITDLMYHHKHLLEKLKGKKVGLAISSSHPVPSYFHQPVADTCGYLHMDYQGHWDQLFPQEEFRDHNLSEQEQAQSWWNSVTSH